MVDKQYCHIGPIEVRQGRGTSRVSAIVCGRPVWFESADVELRPSAEAFCGCFLIPALEAKTPIRVEAPLNNVWQANVEKLLKVFHEWWDYPETLPIESRGSASPTEKRAEGAQCFSAGADSFYTLLRGKHATQYLVFVHGFDMSYRDTARMRHFRPSLEEVCRETGKTAIVIRTNLRRHPFFKSVSWEKTHGAALAAVGHLLSERVGRLVVASSYPYNDSHPCGSHWDTDPLWSSESLEVIHDDATYYRLDKLKRMADEPLVQRHLRVCYQDHAISGNCSRCDKCVRTMMLLEQCGQLQHYPVFDRRTPLPAILDEMDPVSPELHRRYEELIRDGLAPEIEAAARRLMARQRPHRLSRVRRVLRKARVAFARMHG